MECRADTNADPREAGDRLNAAEDLGRVEHPPVVHETRRKVRYPDTAAVSIRKRRDDDSRIALVFAFGPHLILQDDVRVSLVLVSGEEP